MKVAALQITSGPDIQENLHQIEKLVREAAAQDVKFICTPEVSDQIIAGRAEKIAEHFLQNDHPGVKFFSELAKELGVTLLIGSMAVKLKEGRLANRSFLFGDGGELKATYDKIHMFDVDLPTGESHRESNIFKPGGKAVISEVSGHKLGMTICYDMRFSYLFRHLAKAGAEMIAVPSAFTVPTGMAHWHVLLRARAIESGAFIIAPAQVGDHNGVRKTYGHSIIIDPWGHILAEAENDEPCIVKANLDFDLVGKARQSVPSLQHDREFIDI